MISDFFGERLVFQGRVLLVADSQRNAVEAVLQRCGCEGDWSQAVSTVETYNDFNAGSDVTVWAMSLPSKEDAKRVQSLLDAIE